MISYQTDLKVITMRNISLINIRMYFICMWVYNSKHIFNVYIVHLIHVFVANKPATHKLTFWNITLCNILSIWILKYKEKIYSIEICLVCWEVYYYKCILYPGETQQG